MSRPSRDETFLDVARVLTRRSTCLRRAVGCVLTSARGHVLATGYNGRASGLPHCNSEMIEGRGYVVDVEHSRKVGVTVEKPTRTTVTHPHACRGAHAKTGTRLDSCEAIHAEQNALLQCRDVYEIHTCYTTTAPCVHCVKLLLQTACRRVVFAEPYPGTAERLWRDAGDGREWLQLRGERP